MLMHIQINFISIKGVKCSNIGIPGKNGLNSLYNNFFTHIKCPNACIYLVLHMEYLVIKVLRFNVLHVLNYIV